MNTNMMELNFNERELNLDEMELVCGGKKWKWKWRDGLVGTSEFLEFLY